MIKREKNSKKPEKMAARLARRQRGGLRLYGVGGSTPTPPIGDACFISDMAKHFFEGFFCWGRNPSSSWGRY